MGHKRSVCCGKGKIATLIWISVLCWQAPSAAARCFVGSESFPQTVVQITSGNQTGFGLLVPTIDGRILAITANHVIRGDGADPTNVQIVFHEKLGLKSIHLSAEGGFDADKDIAFFAIPGISNHNGASKDDLDKINCWPSSKNVTRGQKLFFVGRYRDWYVPTTPAVVNSVGGPQNSIMLDQIDIDLGSSGAPVFNRNGVAGIITNKVGSQSALAASIVDVIRLLKSNSLSFDFEVTQGLAYEEARVHGQKFINDLQAKSAAGHFDFDDNRNITDIYYKGPLLADLNGDGVIDVMQFWSEQTGTANFHVHNISFFLGSKGKPFGPSPDRTVNIELGTLFYYDPDNTTSYLENTSNNSLIFPGCMSRPDEPWRACSLKGKFVVTFCKDNTSEWLVNLGFYHDEADAANAIAGRDVLSVVPDWLGVNISDEGRRKFLFANPPQDSGAIKGKEYWAFPVTGLTDEKKSAQYGLHVGDYILSANGRIADTAHQLGCNFADVDRTVDVPFYVLAYDNNTKEFKVLKKTVKRE